MPYSAVSSTRAMPPKPLRNWLFAEQEPMPLFAALGLVVVGVALKLMMPVVFGGLEQTLSQFLSVAQGALAIATHLLATLSTHLPK